MVRSLDRRAFLALGLGAIAWACARPGDDEPRATDDVAGPAAPTSPGNFSVIVTAGPGLAVGDTRQGFAILRGQRPIAPDEVNVKLSGPGTEPFDVEVEKEEVLRGPGGDDGHDHEHPTGTEVTDIYVFRHDFDREGVWDLAVSFDDDGDRVNADAQFQVLGSTDTPAVGDRAPKTASPTTDNPRGVDPLCTRTPACDMHDVTIAEALDAGKPSFIVFATPKFCTSRTCGPVVDFVQIEKDRVDDAASFVHVEVWRNDEDAVGERGGEVEAFSEWKLQTEPWIYFVDADGMIKDRWLGAVGANELAKAVDALIEG